MKLPRSNRARIADLEAQMADLLARQGRARKVMFDGQALIDAMVKAGVPQTDKLNTAFNASTTAANRQGAQAATDVYASHTEPTP